jgi:hypothetical protein
MAYESPKEVDFKSGIVLRGVQQWKQFLSFKRGWVKLDPELRRVFPTNEAVNETLRKVIAQRTSLDSDSKRRKTA